MKRNSDAGKHPLPKNFPINNSEFEFVRREMKRNYTTFKPPVEQFTQALPQSKRRKNQFQRSQTVVNRLLNDVVNSLGNDIEKIEMKRTVKSVIDLTNFMTFQLYKMQDPERTYNETCPQPEIEPTKNTTDPIGGFYKQNFIRKIGHQRQLSQEMSVFMQKESSKILPSIPSNNTKKLPSLLKHASQKKLQTHGFIPLEESLTKKSSMIDIDEIIRQRLLKQIENRKFKEKIEAISAGIDAKESAQKKNSKSTYDTSQKLSQTREDCNFDYDGNKIQVFNQGKVKSNMKILKPLYKITKEKQQEKPLKLQKKFHERLSFVPRGSRNYLEFNNKTIGDLGNTDYANALKEKLQSELRKTDVKFVEKQFFMKEKEKRESLLS